MSGTPESEPDRRAPPLDGRQLIVRQFRQTIIWPLQLMPLRPGEQLQRHWTVLDNPGGCGQWKAVTHDFCGGAEDFQERRYKEFVTFLPYVRRFLYGSRAGQEASGPDEGSIRVYRRQDVAAARVVLNAQSTPIEFQVARTDLYFFLDADIAILTLEICTHDIPLYAALDSLYRLGRAYPSYWEEDGQGGSCARRVEWLGDDGSVLAVSDFEARAKFLNLVGRFRIPGVASHWEYLLQPLMPEMPGAQALLRYRQLEHHRMPFMAYLAVDHPEQISRADFVRLALMIGPGDSAALPYSEGTLAEFERNYCEDRFWGRTGPRTKGDTRIIVTGPTLSVVGRHDDAFFADASTGLLGQFRHQYLLLFLIAHFYRAALLSMSDELSMAMNRLTIGDARSVRIFKRTIRQMMEVFLRFTHRYWFHEVSNQSLAHSLFERLMRHLGNQAHYREVRNEVTDMNRYLDSDSGRRQANTILRLTVVTIVGLIGTVASGLLGMNIFAEADKPASERVVVFTVALLATTAFTTLSVMYSKRLAGVLDALSDTRVSWRAKWSAVARGWRDSA